MQLELIIFTAAAILFPLAAFKNFWLAKAFFKFDWPKESFFFNYLKAAIMEFKCLPRTLYAIPEEIEYFPSIQPTKSCFKNPEYLIFSPLLVFLPFMKCINFYRVYFIIHLILAGLALHLISIAAGLPPALELLLFLFTIYHPWLMQHVSIGYSPWITAALFPVAIFLTYFSGFNIINQVLGGLVLSLIVYAGGFHVFVWSLMALAVYSFYSSIFTFNLSVLYSTSILVFSAILFSSPRLIASAKAYKTFTRGLNNSYKTVGDLIGILCDRKSLKDGVAGIENLYNTPFYDSAMYYGPFWVALVGLMTFHVIIDLSVFHLFQDPYILLIFTLSGLSFAVLGVQGVWQKFVDFIPMLSCQNYPYRFLHIACFFLSVGLVLYINQLSNMIGNPELAYFWYCLAGYYFCVFFKENRFHSEQISLGDGIWFEFPLKAYWEIRLLATTFPGKRVFSPISTPKKIIIELQEGELGNQEIILPWMATHEIKDYSISGGEFRIEANLVVIRPTQQTITFVPNLF